MKLRMWAAGCKLNRDIIYVNVYLYLDASPHADCWIRLG